MRNTTPVAKQNWWSLQDIHRWDTHLIRALHSMTAGIVGVRHGESAWSGGVASVAVGVVQRCLANPRAAVHAVVLGHRPGRRARCHGDLLQPWLDDLVTSCNEDRVCATPVIRALKDLAYFFTFLLMRWQSRRIWWRRLAPIPAYF